MPLSCTRHASLERGADHNGGLEKAFRLDAHKVPHHAEGSSTLSEDCDTLRISTKAPDVPAKYLNKHKEMQTRY